MSGNPSFVGSFVGRSALALSMHRREEELPLRDFELGESSTAATSMNLVTTMVGAGVLAVPNVFATVGMPLGIAITIVGCSISCYLCDILSEAIGTIQEKSKRRMRTIEDVGAACYGDLGRRITSFVINGTFIGKTAVYFVLIGQNLEFLRSPPMYRGWVILGGAVFMSLAFVRRVATLEKIVFLGVISSGVFLLMIVLGSIEANSMNLAGDTDYAKLTSIDYSSILPALSVLLFSFGPTDVLATVRNNMIDQKGMRFALVTSHTVLGIFCGVAGAMGFWGFGAGVEDDITQSMCNRGADGTCDSKWFVGYLLAGAVVVNLGASIPIDLYCLFSNIETSYLADEPMPKWQNVGMRLGVVTFCVVIGLLLPFFMEVLEIFCAVLIVPGVIWLPLAFACKSAADCGKPNSFFRTIFDASLFLLGVACLVLGLYSSVHGLLEAFAKNEGGAANPLAARWF